MAAVYETGRNKRFEKLKEEIKSLQEELFDLRKFKKKHESVETPVKFINIPCPGCGKYHKLPKQEGVYELCVTLASKDLSYSDRRPYFVGINSKGEFKIFLNRTEIDNFVYPKKTQKKKRD